MGIFPSFIDQIVILVSIFITRRFLDRRTIVSMGLKLDKQAFSDIIAGISIAVLVVGSIYLSMLTSGWLSFEGLAPYTDTMTRGVIYYSLWGIVFFLAALTEEIFLRGYHLQTIASGTNLTWGIIFSSLIFWMIYLNNPDTAFLSASGFFFVSLLFTSGYLRTGQLWLSTGLHAGWYFFETMVFGFTVGGTDILSRYSLIRITVHGPELWTGGAFGPEAGLIVLPALVLGVGLVVLYTRRRTGRPDIS